MGGFTREHRARPIDTLIRRSDDEAKGLDPQRSSDLTSLRIAEDQFDGLTRHRGDGDGGGDRLHPGSPYLSLPALRFSDGTPITARTFADGLAHLRDPATTAPTLRLFDAIAGIAAPSPDVVEVRLAHPVPDPGDLLAQPALAALPRHRIRAAGQGCTAERPLVTSAEQ